MGFKRLLKRGAKGAAKGVFVGAKYTARSAYAGAKVSYAAGKKYKKSKAYKRHKKKLGGFLERAVRNAQRMG